jgi:hypothetical protein
MRSGSPGAKAMAAWTFMGASPAGDGGV